MGNVQNTYTYIVAFRYYSIIAAGRSIATAFRGKNCAFISEAQAALC